MSELVAQIDVVEQAVSFAESGKGRLLHSLEHVSDEKLTWRPSPTANSPIHIAAHAALSNGAFASMLRGDPMPDMPREEMFAMMAAAEKAIQTREQAVKAIEENSEQAIAALKGLTPARIAEEVQTPFGAMPVTFIMLLVGRHMDGHASQIDYLQTMWGDSEMHF